MEITAELVWEVVAILLGAFILISNAIEKLAKAIKAAKAPNDLQDKRISALEEWKDRVDEKLLNDKQQLEAIEESNRVTQRAILALLDHGLDGNNKDQMQRAKSDLQNHLINR